MYATVGGDPCTRLLTLKGEAGCGSKLPHPSHTPPSPNPRIPTPNPYPYKGWEQGGAGFMGGGVDWGGQVHLADAENQFEYG